jgi:predicted transcriptional regulator
MTVSDYVTTAAAENPALVAAMAAGAAVGLAGIAYVIRRLLPFGLLPLLSRIKKSDLYENDARRLVADLVDQNPGSCLHELVERTGYSRNAVSYHLFVLEKEELLTSVKDGKYRRYFTRGGKYVNGAKQVVSVLKNETSLRIAQYIRDNPGAIQRDVCHEVGTTPSAACWHAKRLEGTGVLRKQRQGNTVQYYLGPAVEKYDLGDFGLERPVAATA